MKLKRSYGWTPDFPDHRDKKFAMPPRIGLPKYINLQRLCPPVLNQGALGSCTANALASAFQFEQGRSKDPDVFSPSRLFIYYNERALAGTVPYDAGATIRDGIKVCVKLGVCKEDSWPYDISKFTFQPLNKCYAEGLDNQVLKYLRLEQGLSDLRGCLALGFPFVFGFSVYESFEKVGESGLVKLPKPREALVGGHAVMCVGYDDDNRVFIIRNSWGVGWGAKGYCYLPYEYLTHPDLAADFWTIRLVE